MPPTKIIKMRTMPGAGRLGQSVIFTCDDGKDYTQAALSELIGLSSSTALQYRIKTYGIHHPLVLSPSCRGRRLMSACLIAESSVVEDFSKLSGAPRERNLRKIPDPTPYDMLYCR